MCYISKKKEIILIPMLMIMIMTMAGNEMLMMGSQKTVMTVMVNAVYLLQIDAFYSFSGTYFFSFSGEKLNKPSDVQVVLMPYHPLLSFFFFAQTIKH